MMVDDQDLPVAAVLSKAPNHTLTPIGDTDPATGAAKRVCSGVNRVGQNMMDCVVNGQLPNQAASIIDCIVHCGQQNTFLPYPEMNLSNTLKFGKLPEYELDSFAHPGIGINIDSIVTDFYIADRYRQEELDTTSLCLSASSERCRRIESSSSLIVPFMPSNSRSLGWRGS